MAVKIYQDGNFHSLAGAKVYHSGAWETLPASAKVYLSNAWHYLGNVSSEAVVRSYDTVNVSSGWVYVDTTINPGARLTVLSGGIAINPETKSVETSFNYDGISDYDYGKLILSGGTAYNPVISGGDMLVSNGGYAQNVTVSAPYVYNDVTHSYYHYGMLRVESGCKVDRVHINSFARMTIKSGGTATDVICDTDSYLYVEPGGTALNVTSRNGAEIQSADGAVITYA